MSVALQTAGYVHGLLCDTEPLCTAPSEMAQPSGAAARHEVGGDGLAPSRAVPRTDGSDSDSGSGCGSSHCTSDCVSARGSPQPPFPPALLGPAEKWMVPYRAFEPDPGGGGGPPSDRPGSPTQLTVRERQLVIQNRLLKSTLIRTLEKLQLHMEDSKWTRRLLSRLMKLRSSSTQQAADPAGTTSSAQAPSPAAAPADLYARYEALVKQNYRLEEALRHSGGQRAATGFGELEEYKVMVNLQMTTMQQDWRDEREEKERALALNAELHQQVEQVQHQMEQLQHQQQQHQPRQPLSEPFETLDPSGFTGSSSWDPQPRRMLPQPGYTQTLRGDWPTRWAAREVRTRGLGPARSVDEVLSAPYEAIRAEPPPTPGRRPPVESDLRRPLPPPGRQPAPPADLYRPAPLVLRDSGYSDLLGAGGDEGDAQPLLSRASVDTGTEDEWTTLGQPADLAGMDSKGAAPPGSAGAQWATPASDEYAATNTSHQVTCRHCGAVFADNEHLIYLNHVEECPSRRRRRGARPCQD